EDMRVLFGSFDGDLARNWSKWQTSTAFRLGEGSGLVTVSRLDYTGQRQHSSADLRNLNTRWRLPLSSGWSLAATANVGWGTRASRITAGLDFQRQRDDRLNVNYVGATPQPNDTARQLDQLEHVTEVGPFVQGAVQVAPHVSVTGGLRYDWVNFRVNDRLITGTNPNDSGGRLMRALSGTVGVAVTPSDALTVYGNVGTS